MSVIFDQNGLFSTKTGYFRILPKPGFTAKLGPKLGTILEKSTILGKWCRTQKFTLARDENANFHLGAYLLRSARSFPDSSAFSRINEPTDAVNTDP